MRWSVLVLLLASLGGFMTWAGCKGKHSVAPNLKQVDIQLAQGSSDITAINHIVGITYAAHTGAPISCGSESLGGQPVVKAGLLWFDLSQVPSNAHIEEVTLVLTVNSAPTSPIEVEAHDLTTNPLTINSSDPTECQNAFDDACGGALYATFYVDSSQTVVEVPLNQQAVADIQSALQSTGSFGIGLRAPAADSTNFVTISFQMDVYIRLKYR